MIFYTARVDRFILHIAATAILCEPPRGHRVFLTLESKPSQYSSWRRLRYARHTSSQVLNGEYPSLARRLTAAFSSSFLYRIVQIPSN